MTRRILLIEDEPLSQDIITSLLRGQGYQVDVATEGFAALDRARAVRYEVALVDYHLPEMDGYALGRLLREQHPGEAGPVLIGLTADRNGLAARRGSDAVFRAILAKPIRPAELFSTIERLCEAGSADGSGSAAGPEPVDARRAAAALWRSHGLAAPPKAVASPAPTAEQAAALTLCFDLVEATEARCVVLLERHGINEALRIARRTEGKPLPIVGLSADHADICDALFRVDDAASWQALATTLGAETPAPAIETPPMPPLACEPKPAPLAGDGRQAPAAEAEPPADEAMAPAIRTLLLTGVRAPLDQLRRDLAAQQRMLEPAGQRRTLLGQLASLDAMLLVTGTIADALNTAGPRMPEADVFDPAEMAENALAMIRDSLPPGQVRASCRISDELPRLLCGDAHRLSQAMLTLLDDACSGPAPVAMTLRLGFDGEQGLLTLRLSLAGSPGEAEPGGVVALLRHLRLTMLGRLVRMMGGALTQDSGEVRLGVPALAMADASPRGLAAEASEPAHVLLIDDGATSGQVLTLLLAQKGHRVCRVGDGEAALFACREARHDLTIFDLGNGEAARQASLDAVHQFQTAQADVPALVLANAFSAHEEARLRDWGVTELLVKPFQPEALDAAVAACRARRVEPSRAAAVPVDPTVRDALVQALGPATVERLTGQLLAQIEALSCESRLSEEARTRLVELSGCACVLGLAELAALCATPTSGGAIDAALHRLRATLELPRRSAA